MHSWWHACLLSEITKICLKKIFLSHTQECNLIDVIESRDTALLEVFILKYISPLSRYGKARSTHLYLKQNFLWIGRCVCYLVCSISQRVNQSHRRFCDFWRESVKAYKKALNFDPQNTLEMSLLLEFFSCSVQRIWIGLVFFYLRITMTWWAIWLHQLKIYKITFFLEKLHPFWAMLVGEPIIIYAVDSQEKS